MKLNKDQKEALITWLSEDLSLEEINVKGDLFEPPFDVSEGQVAYYKAKKKAEIEHLQEINVKVLTPLQLLFCEYFIQTSNGTLSSKLAGYQGNDNVHAVNAHRLLRLPKIRAYISKRYDDVVMDSNEVLARLAKLARASISDYMNEHGVIDWKKVQEEGYALGKVSHTKGQASRIELEGRLRALELIGKAHALFTDKMALTDPTGTKEYGADARATIFGKLLPELAGERKE